MTIFVLILFGFKAPENIDEKAVEKVEIPSMELQNFTLYELDKSSLVNLTIGSNSKKFIKYNTIKDINHTDNSKELRSNFLANIGINRGNNIEFSGDVIYTREDNLSFVSQEATYNTKREILKTKDGFTLNQNSNIIVGTSLYFNNHLGKMSSNKIVVNYQLKENK